MSAWVTLYAAVLFFVLSPNVLLRLPPKGGKFLVAGVHAIIFALIFYLTHNLVWQMTDYAEEGFKEGACSNDKNTCGWVGSRHKCCAGVDCGAAWAANYRCESNNCAPGPGFKNKCSK